MKTVKLSVREFFLFKQVAQFMYSYCYKQDSIFIEAKSEQLESLGY